MGERGISIYVHVPFCTRKCLYCSFPSAPMGKGDQEAYLEGLSKEMGSWSRQLRRPRVHTIYFGGGTPSKLSPGGWERLMGDLGQSFDLSGVREITFEANPESLGVDLLKCWTEVSPGPLRVSLGVQSFLDRELRRLGRVHTASDAVRASEMVLRAGIPLSVDLMFRLPGQSLRDFSYSLKMAVGLGVDHLSAYELTVEEGTPFGDMDLELPPDGYWFYRYLQWYLGRRGFVQYEVSNFARPGAFRVHNLRYWLGGDFLGLGPGAWSCIREARYGNHPSLGGWLRLVEASGRGTCCGEILEGARRRAERAILALRTSFGWAPEGRDDPLACRLEPLMGDLVALQGGRYVLTPRGFRVANLIWEILLP